MVEKDDVAVELLVVVDARLVNLSSSLMGGSDVGRNLTEELEGGLDVVVVFENDEVGFEHAFVSYKDGNKEAVCVQCEQT